MSGVNPWKIRHPYIQVDADGAPGADKFVGLKLGVTVNAEAANVIAVDFALEDAAGQAVAQSWTGEFRLLDGNADATNPGTAFEMDVTTGTGVTAGTQDSMIITSDAAGAVTVDVTDVAGASGSTIYIVGQPLNVAAAPIYSAVTFD